MTEDIYTIAILLLLPLTAGMLVSQANPYHALVMRGILGAVAALVYALFGAADVALTEALVGTMLSITLYAVAVRSSMSMRLGVMATASSDLPNYETVITALRSHLKKKYLQLEVVPFSQAANLQTAFANKDVHAALLQIEDPLSNGSQVAPCSLYVRVSRIYEFLEQQMPHELVNLKCSDVEEINISGRQ